MKGSMRKMLCLGLTALSMGVMMPGAVSAEKAADAERAAAMASDLTVKCISGLLY